MNDIQDLDQYMERYGALLGRQAEEATRPLHIPGEHGLPVSSLLRQPFEAQAHVIEATVKALRRQKAVMMVAEMGCGKTLMAQGAIAGHAGGRPYRALVFCPGQLCNKWERELRETVPGVTVNHIESFRSLNCLDHRQKPTGPEWWIVGRDRAKLGARWRASYTQQYGEAWIRCPQCGHRLVEEYGKALEPAKLNKNRLTCDWVLRQTDSVEGCGSTLWQYHAELARWEPANFIKKHLPGYFKYLVLDEVHEEKSADTAQGNAAGSLAASVQKVIALTGTLIGGYAEHIRPLLFRLAPSTLTAEGLGWKNSTAFNELYGRIETRITEKESAGGSNRESRGSNKTKTKYVRPGIMPTLFGRHLIGNSIFLSLAEVADHLPPLTEEIIPVEMDPELARCYKDVDDKLMAAIKEMVVKGDKRLLGTMLQVLLAYPDYPFDWGEVGYRERGEGGGDGAWHTVCSPANLDAGVVRPKEQKLLDMVKLEVASGNQVWVYVMFNDKRDVQSRLEALLTAEGLRVGSLRASVPVAKREDWINKNGPKVDVVISHPKLVETGLDLFDKRGKHNFSTLIFYETGYNLFTLRQASRRSWRIGQQKECKIQYLYYAATLQERAMALMGRKMSAAQALEGKFSSEGLSAMAGEDATVEMALARSLAAKVNEGDARRAWGKVVQVEAATLPFRQRMSRQDLAAKVRKIDVAALRARILARRTLFGLE